LALLLSCAFSNSSPPWFVLFLFVPFVCMCVRGQQVRVLAARDHSGAVPLLEGRTAAGSLIIACGTFLPEGVYQMVDIQPGKGLIQVAPQPWMLLQGRSMQAASMHLLQYAPVILKIAVHVQCCLCAHLVQRLLCGQAQVWYQALELGVIPVMLA
jgi:hypothetical protein